MKLSSPGASAYYYLLRFFFHQSAIKKHLTACVYLSFIFPVVSVVKKGSDFISYKCSGTFIILACLYVTRLGNEIVMYQSLLSPLPLPTADLGGEGGLG